MNSTRKGKLARLPRMIRDQLNRRLDDGEPGAPLLAWLNALPEVQAVLARQFGGEPITARNLSRWKQGGYRDWLSEEETRLTASEFIAEANAAQAANAGREEPGNPAPSPAPLLSETLSQWVAARYAVATRRIAKADDAEAWDLLREMCGDVVQLRRRDQTAERLALTRERTAAKLPKPSHSTHIAPEFQNSTQPTTLSLADSLNALLECAQQNPVTQPALDHLLTLATRQVAAPITPPVAAISDRRTHPQSTQSSEQATA